MSGKAWLVFLMFLISVFVGLLIYDNYESNHPDVVNNTTIIKPTNIIPTIPFYFENIIFVIVVIVIIFGVFVGLLNYARHH